MFSLQSEFEFRDRGFKETLVLIPGWATDWRIFDGLELDYNYLLPTKLDTSDFNRQLLSRMEQLKISKVSVLGFSLGGFLATEFASAYPEKITKLILLGVRKCYTPQLLGNIRSQIQSDRRPWLYKFYLNCFSKADVCGREWFKKNLLKDYLDKLSSDELIQGLDYLAAQTLNLRILKRIEDISIFHGSDDLIAPVEGALEIKADLPQAKFMLLADRGHLFFLSGDFRERFYHG
ncbi:MAG: alpha/beta fold hydrolase [Candidatus Omnitrophota bacterium]|nr:alpha/beta fold hydrolase [Candidatus Omnitrophota bacterium]